MSKVMICGANTTPEDTGKTSFPVRTGQRGYRPTYNGEPDERPTTGTRLDWSKQPQPIPRGKHIVPIGKEVNDICQR